MDVIYIAKIVKYIAIIATAIVISSGKNRMPFMTNCLLTIVHIYLFYVCIIKQRIPVLK